MVIIKKCNWYCDSITYFLSIVQDTRIVTENACNLHIRIQYSIRHCGYVLLQLLLLQIMKPHKELRAAGNSFLWINWILQRIFTKYFKNSSIWWVYSKIYYVLPHWYRSSMSLMSNWLSLSLCPCTQVLFPQRSLDVMIVCGLSTPMVPG